MTRTCVSKIQDFKAKNVHGAQETLSDDHTTFAFNYTENLVLRGWNLQEVPPHVIYRQDFITRSARSTRSRQRQKDIRGPTLRRNFGENGAQHKHLMVSLARSPACTIKDRVRNPESEQRWSPVRWMQRVNSLSFSRLPPCCEIKSEALSARLLYWGGGRRSILTREFSTH
jgi:hypothetical protein